MLNFDDSPDFIVELEKIANLIENEAYETYDYMEDEIWEIARESKNIPNFSNIYISQVFYKLENALEERYKELNLNFWSYVNNIDSSFVVGNSEIQEIEDLKEEVLDAFKITIEDNNIDNLAMQYIRDKIETDFDIEVDLNVIKKGNKQR